MYSGDWNKQGRFANHKILSAYFSPLFHFSTLPILFQPPPAYFIPKKILESTDLL